VVGSNELDAHIGEIGRIHEAIRAATDLDELARVRQLAYVEELDARRGAAAGVG
jgi:hypothetical protein